MYVRKVVSTHGGKRYEKYVLVESVRTPKGPRQKVVCSLGDLRPRPAAEWLELACRVEQALRGQLGLSGESGSETNKIVGRIREREQATVRLSKASTEARDTSEHVAIDPSRIRTELHREAGPVHVGYQMWERLGLDTILGDVGFGERARTLSCAMVLNRLIYPCSEHAMPDWIRRTALDDILSTDFSSLADESLYRNLDRLYPQRVAIEQKLAAREDTLFNLDKTVLLYDLTSTYFEGQANANPKAKRGYSRDHRPDCKQVVVGLVLNREGFPRGHEVYAGNTQDRTTVGSMLDQIHARVGLKPGQMVVVDRGMAYDANLAEITSRKLHYLVAARQPERDRWIAEFDDDKQFEEVIREPSALNPLQKKTRVRVKLRRTENATYVLCVSDGRVLKDRAIREKHEQRLMADLDKLKTRIEKGNLKSADKIHEAMGRLKERYSRVARYYVMHYDSDARSFTYTLDAERKARAEHLDGSYLLRTDRTDLSADEAWRIYVLLTRVENAFRAMKSPLEERPIFHHLERRVETHIFLCVLAYHLLIAIEKTLLDRGVHTSWESIRETLQTHQLCTIVIPAAHGLELHIRRGSNPEPAHRQIYDWLKMPHEPILPVKRWVPASVRSDCSDQKSCNTLKS
jgi:transposase